ncbi:uncharacterized protein LOC131301658 [Rhododendron vialii]|uniref:uncharacterized protein LOC131301658 n=1 Tax=Rhododendron vialii TaxID=182163 RepID=UPI00265F7FAA|nr:uncharacterized protein LOC131301658 [Rhododendron vialii]
MGCFSSSCGWPFLRITSYRRTVLVHSFIRSTPRLLCWGSRRRMVAYQTCQMGEKIDDILGGQGSAALGDYALDLEMGEQNRDIVESKEQTSPQPSPIADRGKGPVNNEVEVPICLFPTVYPIEEVYHPLLNAIARAHRESFSILIRGLSDSGQYF